MAKNNTTSRKKTATTKVKKSSKKQTKKTTSASVSKKSVSKKVTKKPTVSKSEKVTVSVAPKKAKKQPWTKMKKLQVWNYVMAALHVAQGVAVILLSQNSLFPVTTNYLTVDSMASSGGSPVLVLATRHLFDANLGYVVAAFFFLSAIAHISIATWYRKRYEANLEKGINKARWIEYGLSASVMMVAIAMLVGVSDLSTLLLIFGATSVMNLLGLMMEVHNQSTTKTNWLSFWIGTKSGLLPWITVGLYMWGANQYGEGKIPTFVYWIYGSMFVFFSSFAVNMYLQYRKRGKWADYLYGERAYMILSLVAKSLLAWQVFAGTLRP